VGKRFPAVVNGKKALITLVAELAPRLTGEALVRECYKLVRIARPDRCYSDDELIQAIISYMLKPRGVRIHQITAIFGVSKSTLHRTAKLLKTECTRLNLSGDSEDELKTAAGYITIARNGRPTTFTLNEERLMVETWALSSDHGYGKSARQQSAFATLMMNAIADSPETSAADALLLSKQRPVGRKLVQAMKRRVEHAEAEEAASIGEPSRPRYTQKKAKLLSQARAMAKKPEQNAAMFNKIQEKYNELGAAGKLPGCQQPDGNYQVPGHLIYCGDEMGMEACGKNYPRVLGRNGIEVHRVVSSEKNPFWVTLFFWCRADGRGSIPPCVIHKASTMRGDLLAGLPCQPGMQWLARATESGYVDPDTWYLICAHLLLHIGPARPQFVMIDGFVNHFDSRALRLLLDNDVHVFFLKSQSSEEDQLNDNGPNGTIERPCPLYIYTYIYIYIFIYTYRYTYRYIDR